MSATNSKGRILGTIIAAVLILSTAGLLFVHRQYVADQIAVWSYTPSEAVSKLDERVGFSDKGTFYFYGTHPEVAASDQFNQGCPRRESSSPILGCYANGRIFIYDITNQQLDGIEEVTAAHEMLHAAWDRLGEAQKAHLTTVLKDEYAKHATGELAERMAYYERNEPGEVVNELHSILPTEVAQLNPELETYYKEYFQDRQKVVALHAQYSRVLEDVKSQITQLYNEIVALNASITSASQEYSAQAAALSAAIASFNARASGNGFTSQQQFNSERAALTLQSDQLQASRSAINSDIDRYNEIHTQYQKVAGELDSLNSSLDSITTLPQTPTVQE